MNLQACRDTISMLFGPPMSVMSDCIRGMLIAEEGHSLVACDFSAIEARGLAWLAGEETILEIFRGDGKIYEYTASRIYKCDPKSITKEDPRRQIGKVADLALGYGGGVGAFQTMSSGYGIKITDKEAEIIKTNWRDARPFTVNFWYDLENAAMQAIDDPGLIFSAGAKGREIKYKMNGSFLFCRLPSGRMLSYPYARLDDFVWVKIKQDGAVTNRRMLLSEAQKMQADFIEKEGNIFEIKSSPSKGMTYMSENSTTRQWGREPTYGGSLSENVTQAVCRDLLAEAIVRLEARGYPVVLHAHDEVVCQVKGKDPLDLEWVENIMNKVPPWAAGFPITSAGWMGKRYRK